MANIDAPLDQEIFYLPQGQRIADVHHHHETNHIGRTVEITEGIVHPGRLRNAPCRLKLVYSDNAGAAIEIYVAHQV